MPPTVAPPETKPWEDYGGSTTSSPVTSQSNIGSGIKKIINAASSAVPIVAGIAGGPLSALDTSSAMQIPGQVNQLSQQAGGVTAETLGQAGVNPNVAAGIGTAVSMAPDIAGAVGGIAGLEGGKAELPNAVRGLLTSPEEVGEEMQAGEKAAGIASDTLPVRRGTIMKFPGLDGLPQNEPPTEVPMVSPIVYPKDTATFLNTARQRIDNLGEQMQPQELADYRVILNNMIKGGEVKAGTKPYALASQLYTDTNSLFTNAVAGRDDLNQVYKYAKIMPSIGDALTGAVTKYGPRVVQGALTIGGGGAIWEGIKHLFGGGGEH
jgi:hypothetical protein